MGGETGTQNDECLEVHGATGGVESLNRETLINVEGSDGGEIYSTTEAGDKDCARNETNNIYLSFAHNEG